MSHVYKIGDEVKNVKESCCSAEQNRAYVVVKDRTHSSGMGIGNDDNNLCHCQSNWELVTKNKTMSILNKFALTFKKEPEKSFIKSGVTDSNDVLTTDGQTIFLAWLLKKHGTEFKTEVVDPILADTEKETK